MLIYELVSYVICVCVISFFDVASMNVGMGESLGNQRGELEIYKHFWWLTYAQGKNKEAL